MLNLTSIKLQNDEHLKEFYREVVFQIKYNDGISCKMLKRILGTC